MTDRELEAAFKQASETGQRLLLLKADKVCDCHDPEDLANSEANPHCQKCFGTGVQRIKILTEKMRFEEQNDTTKNSLAAENSGHYSDDIRTAYAHSNYFHINGKDLICELVDEDITKIKKIYSVKNVNKNIKDSFLFYELVCKRWMK